MLARSVRSAGLIIECRQTFQQLARFTRRTGGQGLARDIACGFEIAVGCKRVHLLPDRAEMHGVRNAHMVVVTNRVSVDDPAPCVIAKYGCDRDAPDLAVANNWQFGSFGYAIERSQVDRRDAVFY